MRRWCHLLSLWLSYLPQPSLGSGTHSWVDWGKLAAPYGYRTGANPSHILANNVISPLLAISIHLCKRSNHTVLEVRLSKHEKWTLSRTADSHSQNYFVSEVCTAQWREWLQSSLWHKSWMMLFVNCVLRERLEKCRLLLRDLRLLEREKVRDCRQ